MARGTHHGLMAVVTEFSQELLCKKIKLCNDMAGERRSWRLHIIWWNLVFSFICGREWCNTIMCLWQGLKFSILKAMHDSNNWNFKTFYKYILAISWLLKTKIVFPEKFQNVKTLDEIWQQISMEITLL